MKRAVHCLTFGIVFLIPLIAQAQVVPQWVGAGKLPFSIEMHLHGSMSEGVGSVDAHTAGAQLAGVDVLWWSDHDWRILFHKYVTSFSMDSTEEPVFLNETWLPQDGQESTRKKNVRQLLADSAVAANFSSWNISFQATDGVDNGGFATVSATRLSEAGFRLYEIIAGTPRRREIRPLASQVTVRVAMRTSEMSADARPYIRFILSQHESEPIGSGGSTRSIIYHLTTNPNETPSLTGTQYRVPLLYAADGQWVEFSLSISDDAMAGHADLDDTRDLSMSFIRFGIEARNGAMASVDIDNLHIEHMLEGDPLFSVQSDILQTRQTLDPDVVQLQGTEFSYYHHLNIFSEGNHLFEYDDMVLASGLLDNVGMITSRPQMFDYTARFITKEIHRDGGLVSFNHPFGVAQMSPKRDHGRGIELDLILKRLYGAGILEVGYNYRGEPLALLLELWDNLARSGVFATGTGVSDSHGGTASNWLNIENNNFVSWIYADQPDKPGLIDGLRTGRVVFGERALWDGYFDMRDEHGAVMGQVVFTDDQLVTVEMYANDLEPSDAIVMLPRDMTQPVPQAGSNEANLFYTIDLKAEGHPVTIARTEIYRDHPDMKIPRDPLDPMSSDLALMFSNPIYYVRPDFEITCDETITTIGSPVLTCTLESDRDLIGVHPDRVRIRMFGVTSQAIENLRIVSVSPRVFPGTNDEMLVISGVLDDPAQPARLELDLSDRAGTPITVSVANGSFQMPFTLSPDNILLIDGIQENELTAANAPIRLTILFNDSGICPADCDLSTTVDFNDLICILFEFGEPDSIGDVDGNGVVEFNDLLAALFQFGPCP